MFKEDANDLASMCMAGALQLLPHQFASQASLPVSRWQRPFDPVAVPDLPADKHMWWWWKE